MATANPTFPSPDQSWSQVGWLSNKGFRYCRVNRVLLPVHRALYIAANGPIPKGGQIVFKNGDKTDIRLDNLELQDGATIVGARLRLVHASSGHHLVFQGKNGAFMKHCSACDKDLPVSDFRFQDSAHKYLRPQCRQCVADARKLATRLANKTKRH